MRHFQQIASNVETLPLTLSLARQPELWNRHDARTAGPGSFAYTDDIWVRFRAAHELVAPDSYAERFDLAWYPAWHALPHIRPIVFGLMARVEAVQLGGILLTRIPAGQQVKPHNDRGRWHPEWFTTKAYLVLETNDRCISTCADEAVVMKRGECWSFDNLREHGTDNEHGTSDRITLIISMRCE